MVALHTSTQFPRCTRGETSKAVSLVSGGEGGSLRKDPSKLALGKSNVDATCCSWRTEVAWLCRF